MKEKTKGIKKNVIKQTLNFNSYHNCLLNHSCTYRTVTSIRSFAQQIYTIRQNKVALSIMDNKRYILEDGIHTLAWGHNDIPQDEDVIYKFNFTSLSVEEEEEGIDEQ